MLNMHTVKLKYTTLAENYKDYYCIPYHQIMNTVKSSSQKNKKS